jgi:hypothetical protein
LENHKWIVSNKDLKPAPEHPQNYFVPNFGLDSDIVATQAHIKQSETLGKNNKWNPEPFLNGMLQVNTQDSDSDSSDSDNENV